GAAPAAADKAKPAPRARSRAPARSSGRATPAAPAAAPPPVDSRAPAAAAPARPPKPGEAPVAGADAPSRTEVVKMEEKAGGEKTYTFGAQEVEGRLKSPQILYFLRRVRAQFDPAPLG